MKDEEPIIITEAIRDTLSTTISRLVAGLPMHEDILNTEFTPPDQYFTILVLLGRLREP
jgi:hypothetical protein